MGVTVEQMRAKKMRHLKSYKALAGQIEETRKNLLKYCGLDTYAMVKVLGKLKEVCG